MKFKILILCFVFSGSAFANVRVIGNGGGDTEMRALTQFSAIAEILQLVSASESQKLLDPLTQSKLKDLLSSSNITQWTLNFGSGFSEIFHLDFVKQEVVLNLHLINDRGFYIDQVIAYALLSIPSKAAVTSLMTTAVNRLFPKSNWEFQVFRNGRSRLLYFENPTGLVSGIQDGNEFLDTENLIWPTTHCTKTDFELINTTDMSVKRSAFFLTAYWQCEQLTYKGQVQIQQRKSTKEWTAVLFGVRTL